MRKFSILMLLVIAGVASIMLGNTREVQSASVLALESSQPVSQISQPECWPLDVVVLIDESLSMSRSGGNDPEGYRFFATQEILNLLISNRRAQCTEAVHRLGVIYFTDVVTNAVPLTPIDISATDDRAVWSRAISEAIQAGMPNKYKNGTDPALAFQAAHVMLAQAPALPLPSGYAPRRQVVILLTDGNPEGNNIRGIESYMRTLSRDLSASNWNNRSVWIVAMNAKYLDNPAFDGKTMGQAWRDIATSRRGDLLAEEDYDEQTIADALGTIIDKEFAQPGKRIQCGDFYVDPYLQSVRFVFSKNLRYQDKLVILSKLDDATGQELYRYIDGKVDLALGSSLMTLREDLYRRDGIIEEYSFEFPLPGRWRFIVEGISETDCRLGVNARQTLRTAEVRLVEPAGIIAQIEEAPYYDTEVPLPLLLRLESTDGQPIPLPDYPMHIEGILTLPGGKSQLPDGSPLPVYTFTLTGENLWQSVPPYMLAPEAGMYTLSVRGTSVHENPPTEYTVFTTTLSYEARKLGRLSFVIQSPEAEQSLPCNTVAERRAIGRPIPLVVQLLDPTGQPADADFYLDSELTQSFSAAFLDARGNPLDTIMLTPASRGVGLFEGTLLNNLPNVIGCGNVSAQVTFAGTVDTTRFVLPGRIRTVAFTRLQSEGVLVAVTAPTANERFLLHPDFWAARNAEVVSPVNLAFTLTDLDDRPFAPADAAKNSVESLYAAQLIAPDGTREVLNLTMVGGVYSATGGLAMTQEGTYTFEITANPDAFKEGFIPGDTAPISVTFERYDALWTKPGTFKTVAISSGSLLAFLIALAIYLLTGAPRGVLEITEYGRPNETLAGPFSLSRGRFPTFKSTTLSGLGIKRIRASKAKTSDGQRAVAIKIVDTNGLEIFNNILEVDQPTPVALSQDVEIVYH